MAVGQHRMERIFYPREQLKISLTSDEVDIPGSWHEASVCKKLGNGVVLEASVPVHVLGQNNSWVPALVLGMENDTVFLALPVGNEGGETWGIPINELSGMLA